MNEYVARVLAGLEKKYAGEKEYLQAAEEILASFSPVFDRHPEYEGAGLLERFVAIGIGPKYADEDVDDIIRALDKVCAAIF